MIEVVAALIWDKDRLFDMPASGAQDARAVVEFVGGKG